MRSRPPSTAGRPARSRARELVSAFAGVALLLGCALAAVAPSQAAPVAEGVMPAVAGTPEPGKVVFVEDFQNVPAGNQQGYGVSGATYLSAFPGVAPLPSYIGNTYTGSPDWINGAYCNGMIMSRDSAAAPSWATSPGIRCSNLSSVQSWNFVRLLGLATGQEFGGGSSNFVYSSYSECDHSYNPARCPTIGSGIDDGVLWQTNKPIPLPGPNRYMAFTVDTAAYCHGNVPNPTYQFAYSVPSPAGQPTTWTPLGNTVAACSATQNPNTQTTTRTYTLNFAQTGISWSDSFLGDSKTIRLNRMSSDQAVKLAGDRLHAKMYSTSGVTNGNDGAFDNVRAIDVTPKLDKSFMPEVVADGKTSMLRFTITNTAELNAKTDWNFTDKLPAGLQATGITSTTCLASSGAANSQAAVTIGQGGQAVLVRGSLGSGMKSCTVDVGVKAWNGDLLTGVGVYANGPDNFAPVEGLTPACWDGQTYGLCGLDAPGKATLTVNPVVDLSITKNVGSTTYTAGQQLTYTVTVSNAASTAARPVSIAKNVAISDAIPARVTNATWTCAAGPGASCAASGSGDIADTVTIPPGGSVVYTVTGRVATDDVDVADIVNTAKAVPPTTMPFPPTPGSSEPPIEFSVTDDNCKPGVGCEATVTTPRGELGVTKLADPSSGTTVGKNEIVTYTLAFDYTGTGSTAVSVDYTDDLRGVLDDATFVEIVDAGGLTVTGPVGGVMRITGSITADTSVRYRVQVKDGDRGDDLLRNVVVEGPTPAGPDAPCVPGICTQHPVRYLYVEKIGEGEGHRLDGAVFVLRADVDGTPGAVLSKPTLTGVEDGLFVTGGTEPGVYWLVEEQAPEGFELLATPVRFEVAEDGTVTLLNAAQDEPQVAVSTAEDGMGTITVTDRRAFALPLTGGNGALVFWVGGGLLLVAAAGYVVARRRTTGTYGHPGTSVHPVREACM